MRSTKARKLPERLRRFFWEYRFCSLSWQKDHDLITSRVLANGDWQAVQWLRCKFGDEQLRDWLLRREGAGLSPQQLRFWELILKLPKRRVDRWLAHPARQVWDRRHGA